jgi:hypothetical protein
MASNAPFARATTLTYTDNPRDRELGALGVEGRSSPVSGSERRRGGGLLHALSGRGQPAEAPPDAVELVGSATAPLPAAPATATVTEELPPLPEEVVVHRRLKSAFIDLDALVATLRVDRLTGYLRAQARGFEGIFLFNRGERGLSCYRGEEVVRGPRAGELVRRRASGDDVLLDVVRVRAITAAMLPQLFVGPSQRIGFARFVIVDELLGHLAEEGTEAAVVVTGRRDTAVVVVRGGRIDSAWTRLHPRPTTSLDAVLGVAREPTARVEIVAARPG